jgi:hypothetical protein
VGKLSALPTIVLNRSKPHRAYLASYSTKMLNFKAIHGQRLVGVLYGFIGHRGSKADGNWCRFLVLGYDYYYRNKKPFFLLYTISCFFFFFLFFFLYTSLCCLYTVYIQYDVFFFIHNMMSFFFIHNKMSFFLYTI